MTPPVNPNDIRCMAMALLSRREHLRQELNQKLARRFDDPALIAQTLNELIEEKLLSDQRYCDSYVRMRSGRGYGPERIRLELRQKGADNDRIQLAFETCDTDWYELARDTRLKKFGPAIPEDFKEKSKQLRFLQYRGFSGDFSSYALAIE